MNEKMLQAENSFLGTWKHLEAAADCCLIPVMEDMLFSST